MCLAFTFTTRMGTGTGNWQPFSKDENSHRCANIFCHWLSHHLICIPPSAENATMFVWLQRFCFFLRSPRQSWSAQKLRLRWYFHTYNNLELCGHATAPQRLNYKVALRRGAELSKNRPRCDTVLRFAVHLFTAQGLGI